MDLLDIGKKPLKIIPYIIFTVLLCYFTVGDLKITGLMTLICIWMCMMPRLEHENSIYKNKLPKFLLKGDLINIILRTLFPLVLFVFFIKEVIQQNTMQMNNMQQILMITAPFVVSIIHYLIVKKCKNEYDWLMPLVVSLLMVLGLEMINGNLLGYIKNLFPMFFGIEMNIQFLWTFLIQVFFVYSIYRILSIIFPGRTFAMTITAIVFCANAFLHNSYMRAIGMSFQMLELFNIKECVALTKICVLQSLDTIHLFRTLGTFIFIIFLTHLLSKNASIYNIPKRCKSLVCGLMILLISIISSNMFINKENINLNTMDKDYGYTYYLMNNFSKVNTYNEELQEKIDVEVEKIFGSEEEIAQQSEPTEQQSQEEIKTE